MYVVVDERDTVAEAYRSGFENEGVAAFGMQPTEFRDWFGSLSDSDMEAVEGFVIGEVGGPVECSEHIRGRSRAPILALSEIKDLETTLELFGAGIDDVVRKPVHVKELIARSNAVWRRINRLHDMLTFDRLKVYFDGRDIEIDGKPFELPRRERRILEFLVRNAHRRVTKSQVFNAVYGLFEDAVDEVVVEGHISKLRKKLRLQLGRDVIDAKRYLGYQFIGKAPAETANSDDMKAPSLVAA